MKAVYFEIEDKSLELFLGLFNNLKDGIVKNFTIDDVVEDKFFYETKAYFHECLHDIENEKTEFLSQEQYKKEMHTFMEDLKSKYAYN